jgi:uncharacterized protein (DUF433 family)
MSNLAIAAEPIPLATDKDGNVRVGGTRVTLDSVVYAFKEGSTAEDIVRSFPSLSLADVYAVIAYYLRHKADVEAYLEEQEREAEKVRRECEARFDQRGIREMLLARRNQRG